MDNLRVEVTLRDRLAQRQADRERDERQRELEREREQRAKEQEKEREKDRAEREKEQEKEREERQRQQQQQQKKQQKKQRRDAAPVRRGPAEEPEKEPKNDEAPPEQEAPPKPPKPPKIKPPEKPPAPEDPAKRAEKLIATLRKRYPLPKDTPKPGAPDSPERQGREDGRSASPMEGLIQEARGYLAEGTARVVRKEARRAVAAYLKGGSVAALDAFAAQSLLHAKYVLRGLYDEDEGAVGRWWSHVVKSQRLAERLLELLVSFIGSFGNGAKYVAAIKKKEKGTNKALQYDAPYAQIMIPSARRDNWVRAEAVLAAGHQPKLKLEVFASAEKKGSRPAKWRLIHSEGVVGVSAPLVDDLLEPKPSRLQVLRNKGMGGGRRRAGILGNLLSIKEDLPAEERALLEGYQGQGVMIACYPGPATRKKIAVPGGEEVGDLHMTVVYLGDANQVGEEKLLEVSRICSRLAQRTPPLRGALSGVGRFSSSKTSSGKDVLYLSVDAPELPELRDKLVRALTRAGVVVPKDHGFTPHITLAYIDPSSYSPLNRVDPMRTTFGKLTLSVGTWKRHYPFKGKRG